MGREPRGILSPSRLPVSPPERGGAATASLENTPSCRRDKGRGVAPTRLPGHFPRQMPSLVRLTLAVACVLVAPASLPAQFAPLTVPRGTAALELRPRSTIWSERFRDGRSEPAGQDFFRATLGGGFLPVLADAEARLERLTGLSPAALNAGRYEASVLAAVGELALGLRLGLTNRVTLFGVVPFQRVRVQVVSRFDSTGATSGFNPADPVFGIGAGLGATLAFFTEFDAAITALEDSLAAGRWAGDPALEAVATGTLATARTMRADLFGLLVAGESRSPLVPLTQSAAGQALLARIGALQTTLQGSLGIGGFTRLPALPTTQLSATDWQRFLTDPSGPIAGATSTPTYTALGDIEIGAAWTLIDRTAADERSRVRVALQGTARLRTSQVANPTRFFDLGTGDRQPDGEAMLVADLARNRAAVRLAAWYTVQFPGNQLRRIGAPEDPIQPVARLAAVRKDPGEIVGVSVTPALRLTPRFAIVAGATWWSRSIDRFEWAEGQTPLPDVDPMILAEPSGATAVAARVGLTWSHPGRSADGAVRAPLDASVWWDRVVSATGGRVPRAETIRVMLRLYKDLW